MTFPSPAEPSVAGHVDPADPPDSGAGADPLSQAGAVLGSIESLPLEQHPPAFARFDELLREALESAPPVSSG